MTIKKAFKYSKIKWATLTFPPINLYSFPIIRHAPEENIKNFLTVKNKSIDNHSDRCYHTHMKNTKQKNNKNIGGGSGA